MSPHDNEVGAGSGNSGDNAGLRVGMRELRDCYDRVSCCNGFDLVEEPVAGLGAI